jgi:uncharacterized coiled-coil protein SlyX
MGASKGRVAPKMRQAALNLPSEPAPDYRGELLSVGITSAVLGALGGSVAAAMLLTPKGSAEAFRNGQQEAAQKFELEKAELESKYQDEVEKLKKKAGVAAPAPAIDPEMQKENDFLKGELASKEAIVKKSAEELAALTKEHETLKQSSDKANADLQKVTEEFNQLQESSKTAAKPDPDLQKQLDDKSRELSDVSAQAEQRRQALEKKTSEFTRLEQQHEAIVQKLEDYKATVPDLEKTIRTHEGTIGERNNTIAAKDKTIAGHEGTIAAQANAIKKHRETIGQLTEHVKDLQSQHDQLLSVAQGSNVEELDKLVGTNYAHQRKQLVAQYKVANEALSAAKNQLKDMVAEHNQTLEGKDKIINAQKNQIQKYEELQAKTEGDLLALHMRLEDEVRLAGAEAHQSASENLKGKIKALEKRLSESIGERDELLYGKAGLFTHLSGSGHREKYGGIQLAAALRRGKVDLSDMSEAKFNDKVNYSTNLLLGALESSSLSDNNSPVGTPFLLEWENNHNEILERFKSGDITPEELWKQQAIAHIQHINRRKEFLARMEDFKKTQRIKAKEIASEFYGKYMAKKEKGEKIETVIKKYDAAFRAHYADMKKAVLEIQEEVKKQHPLGGFLNAQGEIDPDLSDAALNTHFSKAYTASLLGKKKRGRP